MRFCLLTRFHAHHGQTSFIRRLVEEANRAGHAFEVVNPNDISLAIGGANPVMLAGQPFPKYDLVHYALRWDDDHTWGIIETLKTMNIPILPPHRIPMGDGITMARLFTRAGIATPRTWVFNTPNQMMIMLGDIPFPCAIRIRRGQQGRRMYVVNHTGEAMQVAELAGKVGQPFMVQEMLQPTGRDVRIFTVGNEVVGALERTAPSGFVWPKEEGNAKVVPIQPTPEEAKMVLAAAKVYNAPYAAVSILRREGMPPVLLELSRAPTLTEIEQVTKVNVAAKIIQYCEQVARIGVQPA